MMFYLLMALIAGVNIIISNSINAALGKRIGLLNNALVFYTVALAFSALAFIFFAKAEPLRSGAIIRLPYYAYIGLLIPIATLLLNTYSMQKFSVVNFVLLTYISEIITAVAIDYFVSGTLQTAKIAGAIFMVAGVYIDNKILEANDRIKH